MSCTPPAFPQPRQFVPGDGSIGAVLVGDSRVAGVAFTGSTEVARAINRALAAKDAAIVPLIAETGGINPMIVDATALPEQVTDDVMTSAFRSAGQRCSALRLLCVQEDVAERLVEMIAGAARELALGDPRELPTHVGPVIDAQQRPISTVGSPPWKASVACASVGMHASPCRRSEPMCRQPSSCSTARVT